VYSVSWLLIYSSGVPIYVWIGVLVVFTRVSRFGVLFKGWNTPEMIILLNLIHFPLLKKIKNKKDIKKINVFILVWSLCVLFKC